jgi:hypothetical protein
MPIPLPVPPCLRVTSSQREDSAIFAESIDGLSGASGLTFQQLAGFQIPQLAPESPAVGPGLKRVREVPKCWVHEEINVPQQQVKQFLSPWSHPMPNYTNSETLLEKEHLDRIKSTGASD